MSHKSILNKCVCFSLINISSVWFIGPQPKNPRWAEKDFSISYILLVTSVTTLTPHNNKKRIKDATSSKMNNGYGNLSKLTVSSLQEALTDIKFERGSHKGKEITVYKGIS